MHDLLQELKTHPTIRPLLAGGERLEWGAKTIPSGGYHALPVRLHAPGLLLCGDGAGLVNIPTLKGIHYAVESGRLAAEAIFAALEAPRPRGGRPGGLRPGRPQGLHRPRPASRCATSARPSVGVSFSGGPPAGLMTVSKGRLSVGQVAGEPDATSRVIRTDRDRSYPAPDGKLTFDKLSSVFAAGNRTRDDQPNHIRLDSTSTRGAGRDVGPYCPAQVYRATPADEDGLATVEIAAVKLRAVRRHLRQGRSAHAPRRRVGTPYTLT